MLYKPKDSVLSIQKLVLGIINFEISCSFLNGVLLKNNKAKMSSGTKIMAPDFKQQRSSV